VQVDESVSTARERRYTVEQRRAMKWALRVAEVGALAAGFWIAEWPGFALGFVLFVLGETFGPRLIDRVERDRWHVSRR
jgi:hypothetical protein